jgi:acetaldehyde dehydrogenase (acetylating)
VKAAYSSGKPAYGVGPGNVPAYVDRSADLQKAVRDVLTGKTFDNGTLCSSEQSIIVDAQVEGKVVEELKRLRACILDEAQKKKLEAIAILPSRSLNPQIVGKSPQWLAERAGISIPEGTRALVVRMQGVGRDDPLSCEKLSTILALYVVRDWREGCERCKQVLAYGGMGHTLAIHCRDEEVIRQFGLEKPAFRICVNTPATHGSIGLSTSIPPSMTLGCGTYGNNITTDNITPMHLIQIKRLARETREVFPTWYSDSDRAPSSSAASERSSDTVSQLVDSYLSSRKLAPRDRAAESVPARSQKEREVKPGPPTPKRKLLDFVCERDVQDAIQSGNKIYVHAKSIVTPAALDLAVDHDILVRE